MKRTFNYIILLLISCLFLSNINASIYLDYGINVYSGENNEYFYDSKQIDVNKYVYVGETDSSTISRINPMFGNINVGSNPQAFIVFANYNDDNTYPFEEKVYGGIGVEVFNGVDVNNDGDVIAVGSTTTLNNIDTESIKPLLVKYDKTSLEVTSEEVFTEEGVSSFSDIIVDSNNNIILGLNDTENGGTPYLYKINESYEEIWKQKIVLNYTTGESGHIESLLEIPNKGYLVTVTVNTTNKVYTRIIMYDKSGNKIWEDKPSCEEDTQYFFDSTIDKSGYMYIAGTCGTRAQLLKYNKSGELIKRITSIEVVESSSVFQSININSNGKGYVALNTYPSNKTEIYRFDTSSLTLLEKIKENNNSIYNSIIVDNKESVFSSGYSSNGNYDAVLAYYINIKPIVSQGITSSAKIDIPSTFSTLKSYKIYYSLGENGNYEYLNTINVDQLQKYASYTHENLSLGKTYYYKVKAIDVDNNESDYSDVSSITIKPTPTYVSITQEYYSSIKLLWDSVQNVSGYKIYRSTSENGTYSLIKTITSSKINSYTNKGLTLGKTYYYKVRSYKVVKGKNIYSDYSNIDSGTPYLKEPVVSATDNRYRYVKINVTTPTPGASGYKYYRGYDANSNGTIEKNEYVYLGRTSKTYKYDYDGVEGREYIYKVIPYRTMSSKRYYGSLEGTNNGTKLVDTINYSIKSGNYNRVNIIINKLDDATKYYVYRSTSKNGKYSLIKTLYANDYESDQIAWTNTGRTFNKTYYYKVKAYYKNTSSYSTTKAVKTKLLSNGLNIALGTNQRSTTININKVPYASGYEIVRSTTSNGTYSLIKRTTLLTYSYDLSESEYESSKTYYYKVRAYKTVNGKKVYSLYSLPVEFTLE